MESLHTTIYIGTPRVEGRKRRRMVPDKRNRMARRLFWSLVLCLMLDPTVRAAKPAVSDEMLKLSMRAWMMIQEVWVGSQAYGSERLGDTCLVVFPGTRFEISDLAANALVFPKALSVSCGAEYGPDQHAFRMEMAGMAYDAWMTIFPDGTKLRNSIATECGSATRIVFAGHSKGGVRATLAAIFAKYFFSRCPDMYLGMNPQIDVITFGEPRFLSGNTVDVLLETGGDFRSIRRWRYCFDMDWACNVYPYSLAKKDHASLNDGLWSYVHWGAAIDFDQTIGVPTIRSDWNWPQNHLFDGKIFRWVFEPVVKALTARLDDLTDIPRILIHIEYPRFWMQEPSGCALSSKECSIAERLNPGCWQNQSSMFMMDLCDSSVFQWKNLQFWMGMLGSSLSFAQSVF